MVADSPLTKQPASVDRRWSRMASGSREWHLTMKWMMPGPGAFGTRSACDASHPLHAVPLGPTGGAVVSLPPQRRVGDRGLPDARVVERGRGGRGGVAGELLIDDRQRLDGVGGEPGPP